MAVGKGSGTTVTHADLSYVVTTVSWDGYSVVEIGTGDLTATIRTYEAGNILDWGTVSLDVEWDGAVALTTLDGAATDLVITVRGATGGANRIYTAPAFLESHSAIIPNEDVMTGTLVFRLTGAFVQSGA